jgi:hypothetical protein
MVLALATGYAATGAIYWRGAAPGEPLQEPMHYVDQYKYPRAWTRSQLAPGIPDPTPFAAVYGSNAVGQRFRSCCDNLAMLRIWLGGAVGQQVVVSLRTNLDRTDTLYSTTIQLEQDGYHDLTFPPLSDSAEQAYFFFVEAPEAGQDEAVALRVIPGDRVGGVPLINEYTAAGNLDFASYHRGQPGGWLLGILTEQVLPRTFAARLRQYKPAPFKGKTFERLLVATVAGAVIWLVVAWPKEWRSSWRRAVVGLAMGVLGAGVLVLAALGIMLWPRHATAMSPGPVALNAGGDGPTLVSDLLLSLYPTEKEPERRLFSTTWTQVDGLWSPCVAAPPDSSLSYGLFLPPEATLRLRATLEAAGAWRRFEVSIAGRETLFSRELRGASSAQAAIDLSSYGLQDVRLLLRTVGREGDTSPGLWCAPQIESARSWLLPYPLPTDVDIHSQLATFGDALELLGYHLETPTTVPGDWVDLTLYWHARRRVETDYTVFVHLLDEGGQMQSQHDSQPVSGAYPTMLWSPENAIVDRYVVPVDEHVPPGQYRLAVGLYDLATLQRLPAFDDAGSRQDDDRALLDATVTVERPP